MNTERDKFLTEAMGECWHEPTKPPKCIHEMRLGGTPRCGKCGTTLYSLNTPFQKNEWPSYNTWPGFGKLWEWTQKQEWFREFLYTTYEPSSREDTLNFFVHPDRFANALYMFLKEK